MAAWFPIRRLGVTIFGCRSTGRITAMAVDKSDMGRLRHKGMR